MPRVWFEKTETAIDISHLDLMRVFQRAFKRAGLHLTHTQGFNPRPSVSIVLPLSVGVESHCELLDFALDGDAVSNEEIMERLNRALVPSVRVLQVYKDGSKTKNLAYLDCAVFLEYDTVVPRDAQRAVEELFSRTSLTVQKRGKNGTVEQDIIPMIRSVDVKQADENTLVLHARVCCQNPTLNPAQLVAAIEVYLPECKPDFFRCCRCEIYNTDETIFR